MVQLNQATAQSTGARGRAAAIDQGLRSHMNSVYTYLSGGLAIAGATAFAFGNTPALAQAVHGTPLKWVVMFAPLALIFYMSFRIQKMSLAAAQFTYWFFTALMGVSLSYVFIRYANQPMAVVQAFMITAVAFMSLSLYGYTTKKSLSGWGSFLLMGLVGLILASIVNMFLQSGGLAFAISVIGVLVFAGLTAYDTQRIKEEYLYFATAGAEGAAWLAKGAVMGALGLFLNFVNMFQMILSLIGMDE